MLKSPQAATNVATNEAIMNVRERKVTPQTVVDEIENPISVRTIDYYTTSLENGKVIYEQLTTKLDMMNQKK